MRSLPAKTTDGHEVQLCANIGSENDIAASIKYGAQGIGLFRTEFLYMSSTHFPTEVEQYKIYNSVIKKAEMPVIIRTIDIGGDKGLPYFQFPHEGNPFLGWRAIRMSLELTDIFKTQLRAILRASAYGKIKIMYPMIISLEEFQSANHLLKEAMDDLAEKEIPFDEHIETGIMVETPAAVLCAPILAKYADFFSIGTNDLTQYTLAVDRGNEKISHMYNALHPAVLRSIKYVIDSAHKENKPVGMCGEMAGNIAASLLLLGMGLDEFSMSAPSIPDIKENIRKNSFINAFSLAQKMLETETVSEVEELLKQTNQF